MTTPDEAATVDHEQPARIRDLADRHIDSLIQVPYNGKPIVGALKALSHNAFTGLTRLDIQEKGHPLSTAVTLPDAAVWHLLEPAPLGDPVIAPVDTSLIRELTSVIDQLTLAEGTAKGLKRRKAELSELLVQQFATNGVTSMHVDERTAYMHTQTGASFQERPAEEGGGKYTAADVVPVLRELGRPEYITPETVNWQTLSSLLREYRDNKEPVPPELAAMVVLRADPEIRVRAPRKGQNA